MLLAKDNFEQDKSESYRDFESTLMLFLKKRKEFWQPLR